MFFSLTEITVKLNFKFPNTTVKLGEIIQIR